MSSSGRRTHQIAPAEGIAGDPVRHLEQRGVAVDAAEKLQAERQAFVAAAAAASAPGSRAAMPPTFIAVLPVEPRPTGAAPQAPSVTKAS